MHFTYITLAVCGLESESSLPTEVSVNIVLTPAKDPAMTAPLPKLFTVVDAKDLQSAAMRNMSVTAFLQVHLEAGTF